jgi:sugar lactone lactonase YvrE
VQKFTFDGRLLEARGQAGQGETELYGANDIAIDAEGNLYLVDSLLHRVQKFDSNFQFIAAWPTDTNTSADEFDHDSIVIGADGRIYVTVSNLRVRERGTTAKAISPLSQVLVFRPDDPAQST